MERATFLSLPAKRPAAHDCDASLRSSKLLKPTTQPQPPLPVLPGHAAFRMLCSASRVGALIGRSGNAIKQLQQSTGSKIRVEEAPVDSTDRVVTVIAEAALTSKIKLALRSSCKGGGERVQKEIDVSKAQEALFRVFEVVLGVEAATGSASCRLLAQANHAGAVIGKGGKVVEKMRKETGCKISVLTEKLPTCVEPGEEVVELEGDILAVKSALLSVSRCLQDCQPIKRMRMLGSRTPDMKETWHTYTDSTPEVTPWNPVEFLSRDALLRPVHRVPQDVLHRPIEILSHDGVRRDTDAYVENVFGRPWEPVLRDGFSRHIEAVTLNALSRPLETVSKDGLHRHVEACYQDALSRQMEAYPQDNLHRQSEAVLRVALPLPIEDAIHRPTEDLSHDSLCRPIELVHHESFNKATTTVPLEYLLSHRDYPFESIPRSTISSALGIQSMTMRPSSLEPKTLQQQVVFRILCPNDRAGGVIGRGGAIIRALQAETGAAISLESAYPDCDERLITITASENHGAQDSPAQKAVALVFARTVEASVSGSSKGSTVAARLVVPSNKIGCLLGKGGAIISEIRNITKTIIQVMREEQNPKNIATHERVVQILGGLSNVKEALYYLTGRLRDDLFSDVASSAESNSCSSQATERQSSGRIEDSFPINLHEAVALPKIVAQSSNLDYIGLDHHFSPELWASKAVAGANSRGFADFSRGLDPSKGGVLLGSVNKSALVTNTTVEIRVPENLIGCVYGENGCNLDKLRRISGARVVVHEPHIGSGDSIIVISGTPEETQAAQSLLQAFIITGESS